MLLRDPAEIPAPVAIALADFCRRADRPSSAEEVRQALARLSPDEDRTVLGICKGEPPARPLSPHAVIDLVRGLPAAEAARLEETGAYEAIAAEAAAEAGSARPVPAGFAASVAAAQVEEEEEAAEAEESPFAPGADQQRARIREAVARAAGDLEKAADELGLEDAAALRKLAGKLGVLEELLAAGEKAPAAAKKATRKKKAESAAAPLRRTRAEAEALKAERARREEPEEEAAPAPRPGRTPGVPEFGRYVTGQAARRPFAELEAREGSDVLEGLVSELRGNRRQIVERLGTLYARNDGRPIGEGDLDRLLGKHHLDGWFEKVEAENLKLLLRQHRGFLPGMLRTLQLEPRELQQLLRKHHLEGDVRELKERTREEARADRPLPERIVLAAEKDEQLRDAGVLEELDDRNLAELRPAIEAVAAEGSSTEPTVVVELARRRMEIEPRVWRKALRRYRLAHIAAAILGVPPPEEPRASRTTGPVEREAAARTNLPVRPRFGEPRREVRVMRIGAAGPAEAPSRPAAPPRMGRPGGGDRQQRPFAAGGERPPRRFGAEGPRRAESFERPPRRFGEEGPRRPEGGARPPRRFGGEGPRRAESFERPPRRFGDEGPRRPEGGAPPPRRFDAEGPRRFEGGARPPRRFGDEGPRRPGGDARPPRRFGDEGPRRPGGDARPPRRFGDEGPPAGRPARPGAPSRPGAPRRPGGKPGGGKKRS